MEQLEAEFRHQHGLAPAYLLLALLPEQDLRLVGRLITTPRPPTPSPPKLSRHQQDRLDTNLSLLLGPSGLLHEAALLLRLRSYQGVLLGCIGPKQPRSALLLATRQTRLATGTLQRVTRGPTLSPARLKQLRSLWNSLEQLCLLRLALGNRGNLPAEALVSLERILFAALERGSESATLVALETRSKAVALAMWPLQDPSRTTGWRQREGVALCCALQRAACAELRALAGEQWLELSDTISLLVEDLQQ